MPFLNGLVAGLFAGVVSAFLIAMIALLPYMGWADYLIAPAFFVTAIPCGIFITLKSESSQTR